MMFIIGMTGGIGSGKSEALKIFESLNIKVIDLDNIAKEITKNKRPDLWEKHLLKCNNVISDK